jgi:hypothetical protein
MLQDTSDLRPAELYSIHFSDNTYVAVALSLSLSNILHNFISQTKKKHGSFFISFVPGGYIRGGCNGLHLEHCSDDSSNASADDVADFVWSRYHEDSNQSIGSCFR